MGQLEEMERTLDEMDNKLRALEEYLGVKFVYEMTDEQGNFVYSGWRVRKIGSLEKGNGGYGAGVTQVIHGKTGIQK